MRTGEFWEEEKGWLAALVQPQKNQDVTALLKKVLSRMGNTDKNNGLV